MDTLTCPRSELVGETGAPRGLTPEHLHLMALVARSSLLAAGTNSVHRGFGLRALRGSAEFGIAFPVCGMSMLVRRVQLRGSVAMVESVAQSLCFLVSCCAVLTCRDDGQLFFFF